jgi:cell division protein FtsB
MKRTAYIIALVLCLFAINSLIHSIYDLWHKQDLVTKAEAELVREKEENKKLKERLTYVKSNEFVESEARNKLFLVKPGESKIIVPDELLAKPKASPTPTPPNWKQWVNLFVN